MSSMRTKLFRLGNGRSESTHCPAMALLAFESPLMSAPLKASKWMRALGGAPRMEFLLAIVLFSVLSAIGFAYIVLFAQLLAARLGLPPAHWARSDHNTQELADYPESLALASSTHRPTPLRHAACLHNSASGYGFGWQRIRTT